MHHVVLNNRWQVTYTRKIEPVISAPNNDHNKDAIESSLLIRLDDFPNAARHPTA